MSTQIIQPFRLAWLLFAHILSSKMSNYSLFQEYIDVVLPALI